MHMTTQLSENLTLTIPSEIVAARAWQAGQRFLLIPSGAGLRLLPLHAAQLAPTPTEGPPLIVQDAELEQLRGMARGAATDNYRDRQDRY
ncbi:AbrB/MazE/SpoVT family DNA-binding domain-containing protein [Massilia sp. MB5]|uniref:AbrB/MazE/SpoVT family DNA-binding domain-containing protein n=1 Tax=Massilia sp. MB5 TaxID=2919578 RepID=UPI001F1084B4|nr:AbrB/MazE/SpoVT family DNA-binding domain-containing protein [Massilia sp. MB5]UMR31461.1 AbrB/MazE/SpoVT family DNA-binding domain-containing protein [Massilia sp. MB5]